MKNLNNNLSKKINGININPSNPMNIINIPSGIPIIVPQSVNPIAIQPKALSISFLKKIWTITLSLFILSIDGYSYLNLS